LGEELQLGVGGRPALVVFDMAGTTVCDDGGTVARCLVDALAEFGYGVTPAAANGLMGLPKPEAINRLLAAYVPDPEERNALVPDVHDAFLGRMVQYYRTDPGVRAVDGAEATFARLRAAGVRVALDTGFSREVVDVILDRLAWHGRIDASVASDEVPRGRPYPDMLHYLMGAFGILDPAQVAKVGDTPTDLEQGTTARCGWVVGVTGGSHTREQLEPYPHTHLIPTVAQLPALFDLS
jgi:phosphonatase-like hydrolase